MRIFRTSPQAYEAIRAEIDAAFGYPYFSDAENPGVPTTESCMVPVSEARKDGDGNVYIALAEEHAVLEEIAPRLTSLLADGVLVEVDGMVD